LPHCRERQLLPGRDGSKVKGIVICSRACFSCATHTQEVAVTSRLRELIQQLGEAIHESVIESDQIAGVVQDIRNHGFDVLLMLEATIGLNEVDKEDDPTADAEGSETGKRERGAFTQNDLSFLRSLRISVEGEEDGTTESSEE
jgi:uncharacterized protein (UPF0335 family)